MDFLAEVTFPDKGEHLVRYNGWYSHRQRGIRAKLRRAGEAEQPSIDRSALAAQKPADDDPTPGSVSRWTMLIWFAQERNSTLYKSFARLGF